MTTPSVLLALTMCLQVPTSQPTSRPSERPTDAQRQVEAKWPADAPGTQVAERGDTAFKWLPMVGADYATADAVADTVTDEDLVIGLEVGGRAFAYPIKMLGGPQREIVNDEVAGVPFAVNW